jgi:hypothetical protein
MVEKTMQDEGIDAMHADLKAMQQVIDEIIEECVKLSDGWAIHDGMGLRVVPPALSKALDRAIKARVLARNI